MFLTISFSLGLFGFSSMGISVCSLAAPSAAALALILSTVSFAMSFLIALNEFSYDTFIPACLSACEVSTQTYIRDFSYVPSRATPPILGFATGTPRECWSASEKVPPFSPGFMVLFIISLIYADGAGLGETYLLPYISSSMECAWCGPCSGVDSWWLTTGGFITDCVKSSGFLTGMVVVE